MTSWTDKVKCDYSNCSKTISRKNLLDHTERAHGTNVVKFTAVDCKDIRTMFGFSKSSTNSETGNNTEKVFKRVSSTTTADTDAGQSPKKICLESADGDSDKL